MGAVVKLDERGRLVIPSDLRKYVKADYFEVRVEGKRLVLAPIPDPLGAIRGRVSRARPMKDLGTAAEEEAERTIREGCHDADS